MTAKNLKSAFDNYFSFPIEFWESIFDSGDIIVVKKETTLKKPHQTEKYLYFIMEGSGGILLWNNTNFICIDMVLGMDFLCDYLSLITGKETPYEVISFEDSTLFRISLTSLDACLANSKYEDKFWRHSLKALFIDKHLQFIQTVTNTAESVYKLIIHHQPEIVERIPQKYIASYLGITPQSLSRIRKKVN